MSSEVDIVEALKVGGFLRPDATPRLEPLSGGVSSEVLRMEMDDGPVCVKQALARLRVAADWRAPVERSRYEVEWFRTARPFVGAAVPEVLFEDRARNLFVMNYYPGWAAIVSARSGETEDVSIAPLATGWDAGQIKIGSFARSERMAKWNELCGSRRP